MPLRRLIAFFLRNSQNAMSIAIDSKSIVRALAYQPEDRVVAVGNYQLTTLVEKGALAVGKVVADQTATRHTKRLETVALTNGAEDQRE